MGLGFAADTVAGTDVVFDPNAPGAGGVCANDLDCYKPINGSPRFDEAGPKCINGRCGCNQPGGCLALLSAAVCDVANRRCIAGCTETEGCKEFVPYCKNNTRVTCLDNSHCTSEPSRPYCGTGGACVQCLESTDCASNAKGHRCNNGFCDCGSPADCPADNLCADGSCIPKCLSDDNCNGGTCIKETGACLQCTSDAQCTGSWSSHCDLATNNCSCMGNNAYCAYPFPVCWQNNRCGCDTAADCGGKPCEDGICL